MDLAKFIQNHKELNDLPFLIVFKVMIILNDMGMLKIQGDKG
jgi:hypothetical protein